VLGAALGAYGGELLQHPEGVPEVPPHIRWSTAPVMLTAAIASRYVNPTGNDLRLMAGSTLAAGWTGILIGSGEAQVPFGEGRGRGGLLSGLAVGYLGSAGAAAFVEVPENRTYAATAGLLAGNLLGLGVHMVADPQHSAAW